MSFSKPTYPNHEEKNFSDGFTKQGRKRPQCRKKPMKPNESPKVSEERKLYFLGNSNERYAQDIILRLLKKTIQNVEKNSSLRDLYYKVSPAPDRNSDIEDFKRAFNNLVNEGLLQYLFDELGITFFGVFLMLDKENTPCFVFGKKEFRPELMNSMTNVIGFHPIYHFDKNGELRSMEISEWKLKKPKKEFKEEPVLPPSMQTDFPPLPQVSDPVEETSDPVEEPEQVEEPPVQKIDVVKSSRDSVLDKVRLLTLKSFAEGKMTNEELFAIFENLPTV